MAAPPSLLETQQMQRVKATVCEKQKQLVAANKLAARLLLLSISSSITTKSSRNG